MFLLLHYFCFGNNHSHFLPYVYFIIIQANALSYYSALWKFIEEFGGDRVKLRHCPSVWYLSSLWRLGVQEEEILHRPLVWDRWICYSAQRRDFERYLYMFWWKILLLKCFILVLDTVSLQFSLIVCGRKDHAKILSRMAEFLKPGHWHQGLSRCVIPAGVLPGVGLRSRQSLRTAEWRQQVYSSDTLHWPRKTFNSTPSEVMPANK